MSDGDPEERAERLQDRFSSQPPETDQADEAGQASETGEAHEASNTPNASEATGTPVADETPIRELPTKLLYLEEDVKEELELAFDEVNLRYKRETGEELQENRHWWPVLLRLGYEALGDVEDLDLEEFEELLEE